MTGRVGEGEGQVPTGAVLGRVDWHAQDWATDMTCEMWRPLGGPTVTCVITHIAPRMRHSSERRVGALVYGNTAGGKASVYTLNAVLIYDMHRAYAVWTSCQCITCQDRRVSGWHDLA